MAQRKASVKPKPDRRRNERPLTFLEQEYIEKRPRFQPAPLPDHVPKDSVLQQRYSLEYLMEHPEIADQYIREAERYLGPLPKVRITYKKQSHGKKKTTKPRKATTRHR